jgi:hypothetical protein
VADYKLKTVTVRLTFSTTSGYRSEAGFGGKGIDPNDAICGAIDELARIAALNGIGERASAAVADARSRVAAYQDAASLPVTHEAQKETPHG